MKILLINPNTTDLVTRRAVAAACASASGGTIIEGVTGYFGAPIINSLTDNAIGTYCAIELAAQHAGGYDAVVLAVSFDSGLLELREMLSIPVAGMSESAMRRACEAGEKFSLISFGERTKPLYRQLASRYGMGDRLASVRCIETLSAEQMADTDFLVERVSVELERAESEDGAQAGILSATVFAGLADRFAVGIPVIDGIAAAIADIEADDGGTSLLTSCGYPQAKRMSGVSDALRNAYLDFPDD